MVVMEISHLRRDEEDLLVFIKGPKANQSQKSSDPFFWFHFQPNLNGL